MEAEQHTEMFREVMVSSSGGTCCAGSWNHAQNGLTCHSECNSGVRGHQDLPHRLARILRVGLIGLELRKRTNGPMWLKTMLDFVDQDNGPFSNRGLLDRQGSESSGDRKSVV